MEERGHHDQEPSAVHDESGEGDILLSQYTIAEPFTSSVSQPFNFDVQDTLSEPFTALQDVGEPFIHEQADIPRKRRKQEVSPLRSVYPIPSGFGLVDMARGLNTEEFVY